MYVYLYTYICIYITNQEFNRLTSKNIAARLKLTNLVSKTDILIL